MSKEEFYKYGESLGIKINDLQRLKMLANKCEEDNDWTKGCNCKDSIGQTWCCNQCGLPYDTRKSYKKYTEEHIRNAIQVGISAEAGDYPKGWSYKLGISLEDYYINSLNKQDYDK